MKSTMTNDEDYSLTYEEKEFIGKLFKPRRRKRRTVKVEKPPSSPTSGN